MLDCEKKKKGLTIQLEGTGLLTLREGCREITINSILIPNKHLISKILIDIIPESTIFI